MKINEPAIILAAGRGKRLEELTQGLPKPVVEVNNVSIIENLVKNLIDCGIKKIVVLIGYKADYLRNHIQEIAEQTEVIFIENDIYDKTNNIYSLWLAKKYLEDGFFLFEADIFFEKKILELFIHDERENLILVDKFTEEMNGTVIKANKESDRVNGMFLKKNQLENFDYSDAFKTINFYKISKEHSNAFFIRKLEEHIQKNDVNSYYELIIKEAIELGFDFFSVKTNGLKWWEIDTLTDLKKALQIFGNAY